MHLFKNETLAGSAKAVHYCGDRLMVSPAVHHLIVMADDDKEITQIMNKLEIIDIDKLQIPSLMKMEE